MGGPACRVASPFRCCRTPLPYPPFGGRMTTHSSELSAATRDALLRALDEHRAGGGSTQSPTPRLRELFSRLALDEMFQFVGVLAPDGTLLDANNPALDAGGIRREEILGRPFWEAHWWQVSPAAQAALRRAVERAAGGTFVRYEAEMWAAAAGQGVVTVDFSIRPVKDGDGRVVFLVAEARDITERRLAQAELARRNAELETLYGRVKELDDLKTRFFANVSHELRTPLALVLGPVEQLLAGDLPPGGRAPLEVVARNARTLLKQVDDLLDVSKLEAGGVSASWGKLDLAELVRLSASHFDALAAERGMAFSVEAPASLPAEADADKLERVLLNLVGNAFKFTPAGGRIRVTLSADAARARVEVADSGPGIPEAERERVFERFRQLDAPLTRRFGGIGLGLAIARDFVTLHGGRIQAGDAPEGGASMTFELPLQAPPGVAVRGPAPAPAATDGAARAAAGMLDGGLAPAAAGAPEPGGDRPLVLVVEDHPEMNAFLRGALGARWRTAAAFDGEGGLEAVRALRPDLVLTDVMMPGSSGPELIAALRADPELADTPVVVLTAKADDALRTRLLAGGAQDYVQKPVLVPELLARIGNLLEMKQARDVLRTELAVREGDAGRLAVELARRRRELATALASTRFAREHAERASAQKSALLHLVSHELRTPLSVLLLQLERVRRETTALSPRQAEAVARMRAAARRLSGLVDTLLEYARIESGRLTLAPEPFDAAEAAAEIVEELRVHAEQKGLAVELEAGGPLPLLVSDRRLLGVVLVNLLQNAIKFTDTGRIGLAVGASAAGHVFRVTDTGRGISADDQARIFEPFEQLERLARKHTPGVGLGLTLVREMVGALGGNLALASTPGLGSTFTVTVPSLRPEATAVV